MELLRVKEGQKKTPCILYLENWNVLFVHILNLCNFLIKMARQLWKPSKLFNKFKVTPILIFLKRPNFEKKNHFIAFTRAKLQKKVNFEILVNIPPFFETKFFRTWPPCQRIWHFCLSEVVENVTNRFHVPNNLQNQILGHPDP